MCFAGLTLEEMAAQALVFFAAGFETVSSAMSFFLYEIAVNKEVQVKLRKEVDEIFKKYSGKPSYQAVQEMTYADAVINGKNLRLHYVMQAHACSVLIFYPSFVLLSLTVSYVLVIIRPLLCAFLKIMSTSKIYIIHDHSVNR